jgi:hypothetical protein
MIHLLLIAMIITSSLQKPPQEKSVKAIILNMWIDTLKD